MKTFNGRPAQLGSMWFDQKEEGTSIRKFCVGYCQCGKKVGLTSEELREFAENMPGFIPELIQRLFRLKIIIPK